MMGLENIKVFSLNLTIVQEKIQPITKCALNKILVYS